MVSITRKGEDVSLKWKIGWLNVGGNASYSLKVSSKHPFDLSVETTFISYPKGKKSIYNI